MRLQEAVSPFGKTVRSARKGERLSVLATNDEVQVHLEKNDAQTFQRWPSNRL